MTRFATVFFLFAFFSGFSWGQESDFMDADAITKGLSGYTEQTESEGGKDLHVFRTRSIGVRPGSTTPTAGVTSVAAHTFGAPPSVDLVVPFEFDSDKLTRRAVRQLDELARALNHPSLQSNGFEIVGHTDAVGTPSYNQKLSERRAASVKEYLTTVHRIDTIRLSTSGMGLHNLLDPNNPSDGRNRRVEVKNIGGSVR